MTAVTTGPATADLETTHEIQSFLYHEAELLDAWRLHDWLTLLTEDCRYLVPATDTPEAEHPERSIFIISDNREQLIGRVERLKSGAAFVETPHSRTRRLITNIRVRSSGPDEYRVDSNFAVYRNRRGVNHVFVGSYRHLIVRAEDGSLRIKERRAVLDADQLRPQGKISFIL